MSKKETWCTDDDSLPLPHSNYKVLTERMTEVMEKVTKLQFGFITRVSGLKTKDTPTKKTYLSTI